MSHIICFGDSITHGENDHQGGGWVNRLKVHFINQFMQTGQDEICVFNLGIGGETTAGLMSRFQSELLPRLSGKNDTVVLGYGANDLACFLGKQLVSVEDYAAHLGVCIGIAKERDVNVFLVNILPISNTVEGIPNVNGAIRHPYDIEKYNRQLASLAVSHDITLIDVHSAFNSQKELLLTPDGVHPNATGHESLFRIIQSYLSNI